MFRTLFRAGLMSLIIPRVGWSVEHSNESGPHLRKVWETLFYGITRRAKLIRITSARIVGDLYFNQVLSTIFFSVSLGSVSGVETRLRAELSGVETRLRAELSGVETRLRAELSGVWSPARANNFSLLQNVQTGSRAYPVSCSLGTGVLSREYSGRGVKFISVLVSIVRTMYLKCLYYVFVLCRVCIMFIVFVLCVCVCTMFIIWQPDYLT